MAAVEPGRRFGFWVLVLVAVSVFCSVSAHAEGAADAPVRLSQTELDNAERLFFEALANYRAKKFEDAAIAFQKAYVITQHRDLLFNLARSREHLGDKEGAVEWYRAYLETKPADETAVIHRIKQLGGDLNPPKKSDEPVATRPDPTTQPEVVEAGAGPWPWIALSAGVLAAGAGTYFGLTALDDASGARDAELRGEAESLKDSAESNALYADISFGVSAVAVGTAVFLWLQSDAEAATSGQVQVTPTAAGAGVNVGYFLRF